MNQQKVKKKKNSTVGISFSKKIYFFRPFLEYYLYFTI